MKALLQRVSHASVTVRNQLVAKINGGLLVFLGVEKTTRNNKQIIWRGKLLIYGFLKMKTER